MLLVDHATAVDGKFGVTEREYAAPAVWAFWLSPRFVAEVVEEEAELVSSVGRMKNQRDTDGGNLKRKM